ncbi:MAG: hypothetical protein AAF433_02275 [Bacteroidota bacterium]
MSSKIFEISLRPHGRFFFGGETIFGQGDDDERRRSYLVKSEILPQQSSLLGMLRYLLLRENKLLYQAGSWPDQEKTVKLVGRKGFSFNPAEPSAKNESFGIIKGISPLRISDGTDFWDLVPLDQGEGKYGPLKWKRPAQRDWQLAGLDAKQGLEVKFRAGAKKARSLTELFPAQTLTGNRVTNRHYRPAESGGAADEEGLFRQTFRRSVRGSYHAAIVAEKPEALRRIPIPATADFQLVFRVEIEVNTDLAELQLFPPETVVQLGGERSRFAFAARELKEEETATLAGFAHAHPYAAKQQLDAELGYARIILLSDTYPYAGMLAEEDLFIVAKARPFRYLLSPFEGNNGSIGSRAEGNSCQLLERGGVILAPKGARVEAVAQAIQGVQPFYQIGYNYCYVCS